MRAILRETETELRLLARLYNSDDPAYLVVAKICDEILDKSGAMLGRVRDEAAELKRDKEGGE